MKRLLAALAVGGALCSTAYAATESKTVQPLAAFENLPDANARAFVQKIKELEDARTVSVAGGDATAVPFVQECRPSYWKSRFMPAPLYQYVKNPQCVGD